MPSTPKALSVVEMVRLWVWVVGVDGEGEREKAVMAQGPVILPRRPMGAMRAGFGFGWCVGLVCKLGEGRANDCRRCAERIS